MIGRTIQRTFSMTVLATYSPYLSAQLCEVTGIDLPSTEQFYCTSCPGRSDLPTSTFFLCHCWSRTPLGRGGCTKATNTMYKSATIGISSLWGKSPTCLNEPSPIKQKCLSTSLEDYLQINAFSDRWWWSERSELKLYQEATGGSHE